MGGVAGVAVDTTSWYCFFFFNDTATTEIYTLSLHDALPIYESLLGGINLRFRMVKIIGFVSRWALKIVIRARERSEEHTSELQSRPHISYAVFCLKKKNISTDHRHTP